MARLLSHHLFLQKRHRFDAFFRFNSKSFFGCLTLIYKYAMFLFDAEEIVLPHRVPRKPFSVFPYSGSPIPHTFLEVET